MQALESIPMVDKYSNFRELSRSEIEGRDYSISCVDRGTKSLVIGPHAGAIESGTSEIVSAVAGADLSYYLFEGIKASGNWDLHIKSTNFDEPNALNLVVNSEIVLAIHGEGSENDKAYLGGRNQEIIILLEESLEAAGFNTGRHENPELQGISPANICNRCACASGVQLELGRGLRKRFFRSLTSDGRQHVTEDLHNFAKAIRQAMGLANAF